MQLKLLLYDAHLNTNPSGLALGKTSSWGESYGTVCHTSSQFWEHNPF